MSEYQYYEWQTIDRPLTPKQRQAVENLSSHIEVTPTQATVTYEWGNFKHDFRDVLAEYFDASLYYANWGERLLSFRFPPKAIPGSLFEPFLDTANSFDTEHRANCQLLHFQFEEDEYDSTSVDLDNLLDELLPLRQNLLEGDTRVLYLAWLKAINFCTGLDAVDQNGIPDPLLDEPGPPIPPGLGSLTPHLQAFCHFFNIPTALVKAAAHYSPKQSVATPPDYANLLTQLSQAEKDDYLLRLLQDEAGLAASLRRKLHPVSSQPATEPGPSIGEILRRVR